MGGKVYLIGAGPGDTGLITVRGLELVRTCDVIVYDYLANEEFLEHAKKGVEIIYAGKKGGDHTLPQGGINSLLIEKAKSGKSVARLKGGDPFIFGRGGEEAEELVEAGVDFEVVPGVTAAVAACAYAGIPLTHRSCASSVAFVTGHEKAGKQESAINWKNLSIGTDTLVFFMGVKNLPHIVKNLVKNGRPAKTPVALIRRGTTPDQKTWLGTLDSIVETAEKEKIAPPSLIVVGEVVKLREKLNWFEKKPLFGKRIVVTRARAQAGVFVKKLEALGASALEFPTIETAPPDSWSGLDKALDNVSSYQWVIFTSVNGVGYLLERMREKGRDIRDLAGPKICAIGRKTADAVEATGMMVELVPEEFRAEAIIDAIGDVRGQKILIPRARKAREILPEQLREKGADVEVVIAYQTLKPTAKKPDVIRKIRAGEVDMVTFTSSSTVSNFAGMFEKSELAEIQGRLKAAAIGPITKQTAEKFGFGIDIMPNEYTMEGLTQSIVKFYAGGIDG